MSGREQTGGDEAFLLAGQEVASNELRDTLDAEMARVGLNDGEKTLVMARIKKETTNVVRRRRHEGKSVDKNFSSRALNHALGVAEGYMEQLVADRQRGEHRLNPQLLNKGGAESTFNRFKNDISRSPETKGKRKIIVLVACDLDDFRNINNKYGHAAGDAVLKSVGKAIEESIRGEDFGIHYSGDEFGLILPMEVPDDLSNAEIHKYVKNAIKKIVTRIQEKVIRRDGQTQQLSVGFTIAADETPGVFSNFAHDADSSSNLSKIFKIETRKNAEGKEEVVQIESTERIIDFKEIKSILRKYPPETIARLEAAHNLNRVLGDMADGGYIKDGVNVHAALTNFLDDITKTQIEER